ncbi:hypothetical protein PG999_014481 [Apiospora kogelbergensis]|uniref:Uncharacterized protein n=1 Tax=Apiospora kogelbergensis TaxID=1337665 RepID=A0AAW0Q336_9PEZI
MNKSSYKPIASPEPPAQCRQISAFKKTLILVPICFSTTISYVLLANTQQSWTVPNGFYYDWITDNRASTQTIVQILAAVLGICPRLTVSQGFNFLTRRSLSSHPLSLDFIDFLNGLAMSRVNWSLPLPYLLLLCVAEFLALIPAALWAGALTPVYVPMTAKGPFWIKVPTWSNATQDMWWRNCGRSYGAGSSVGLNDSSLTQEPHVVAYSYNETAYHVKYQCTYNGSVKQALEEREIPGQVVKQYFTHPTSQEAGYMTGNFAGTDKVVASSTVSEKEFVLSTMGYSTLQNVSCWTDIVPTLFQVNVHIDKRQISVIPIPQAEVSNLEPPYRIAIKCTDSMAALAMISSTSYTSIFPDMLMNNIYKVQKQRTNETVEQKNLRGVAESANALFDQSFIGDASAQLVIAQEYSNQNATVTVLALTVGQPVFIYLAVAMNTVVLIASLAEAIRTKFWGG